MKIRTIEVMRLVAGCETCRILNAYGPGSPEAMGALAEFTGKPLFGAAYLKFLAEHEAYHAEQGEVLPSELTVAGIAPEVMARIVPPVPKPVFVRPVVEKKPPFVRRVTLPLEKQAHNSFAQVNGRTDNKPVVAPLVTKAFAGW